MMYILLGVSASIILFWVYKLIRLRWSIRAYATYWKLRQSEPGDFVYVALGDSAAQGVGTSSIEHSYVARVASRIAEQTGRKVRVINISRSGATTEDVKARQLTELEQYSPDLVTLAIGGNDIRQFNEVQFQKNMEHILDRLPEGSYVADAPYFMHGEWKKRAIIMRDVTKKITQEKGMYRVSLYERMKQQGWRSMFNAYAADWFHPNDRGYDDWFEVFWQEIATSRKY